MAGRSAGAAPTAREESPVEVVARLPMGRLAGLAIDDGFAAIVRAGAVAATLGRVLAAGGDVAAAVAGELLVGYLTVHPIEPIRWEGRLYHRRWERLARARELGSVEVSRDWRGRRIGERLVTAAFGEGRWDGWIVISEELSWHWDYEQLNLSKREYRLLLQRLLGKGGFREFKTDDPNITADPANMLMARIGPVVPTAERDHFGRLLFAADEIGGGI